MLELNLSRSADSVRRVLWLGSHCDDIEIGCGGTILKLLDSSKNIMCCWVVFGADQQRAREARESANMFLERAKTRSIVIKYFRDGFFPYIGSGIKECFERLKQEFSPDLIFTHYRSDLHQDHRLIAELTWNTFRDHIILEYEIPKYDGDLGSPNVFVHLDEPTCRRKIRYILDSFKSQRQKRWFGEETFLAIMRLRGMEANAPSKYAEAFYCRKMVWGLASGIDANPNNLSK